ncbi:hypothetical protein SVAN01_01475 [Stagonosporopsis vannaccii]|nr:hypothetical protein SVAN01_01475 [Stagonosporopsis vannaccii]
MTNKTSSSTSNLNELIKAILKDKRHAQENAKRIEQVVSDALKEGVFEKSGPSSNMKVTTDGSCIDQFINDEWKNKSRFQRNAENVKNIISDMLKEDIPRGHDKRKKIKHQLSARAKEESSLRKKLSANSDHKTLDDIIISGDIWDLAGVRVLVYFPDDVHVVLDMIMDKFPDIAGKPFVRDNKRIHKQLPNRDWDDVSPESNESRSSRIREGLKGPWLEQSTEQVRAWQHHGYTAVHLTVLFPTKGAKEREERESEIAQWMKDKDALEEEKAVQEEPKRDSSHQSNGAVEKEIEEKEQRLKKRQDERYRKEWASRVEIQITTVVMHAWSEVEHDLIYKNIYDLPHDLNIDRILDATNGLSITSEILLSQLQQTLGAIEEREDQELDTDLSFESALEELYGEFTKAKISLPMKVDSKYTPIVRAILAAPLLNRPVTCRRQLRPLFQKHKDLIFRYIETKEAGTGDSWIDLSRGLLCALGDSYQSHFSPLGNSWSSAEKYKNEKPVLWTYKCLLAMNIISIAAVLLQGNTEAESWIINWQDWKHTGEGPFPPAVRYILSLFKEGLVNFGLAIEILLSVRSPNEIWRETPDKNTKPGVPKSNEPQMGFRDGLETFIDQVLGYSAQKPHSTLAVASALAHMSYFIAPCLSNSDEHAHTQTDYTDFPLKWNYFTKLHRPDPLPMDFSFIRDILQVPLNIGRDSTAREASLHRYKKLLVLTSIRPKRWSYVSFWNSSPDYSALRGRISRFRRVGPRSDAVGRLIWIPPEVQMEYILRFLNGAPAKAILHTDIPLEELEVRYLTNKDVLFGHNSQFLRGRL